MKDGASGRGVNATMDAIIFLGPSMPQGRRPSLTGLCYRPPIRRGDLKPIIKEAAGCIIGIVDGVFDQFLAISPREIMDCLQAGCTVYGSSSMGALRAVELSSSGMRGVGRIFEMYQRGEVTSDDEVAIIFDPESNHQLTESLVNIRCSVREAVEAGLLKHIQGEAIVRASIELPYWLRSYPKIIKRVEELLGGVDLRATLNILQKVNQKERDALALLDMIAARLADRGRAGYRG